MNRRWLIIIIVILCAIPLVPLAVNGISTLVFYTVHRVTIAAQNLLQPLSQPGEVGLQSAVKLCLYLIFIVLIARFLFRRGD